jgi:membrane associated rhomboid family serine protease
VESEAYGQEIVHPFRVCESCGRLTPRAQAACVNCGVVSMRAAAEQQARAEQSFVQSLWARATPVTYALLIVNIALFGLMLIAPAGADDPAALIAFGAKTNSLLREGDWYRLVTPIFIHGGLLHLLFNSYALYATGPLVEKLYGSARFLLIYLLAGIGGVMGSFIWQTVTQHPDVPSVGASGALFGLFGLQLVFAFRNRQEVPLNFRRALRASVLPVIVINLLIGFALPFIDNGAHIGGLLTGALLAFFIPYLTLDARRVSNVGLLIMIVCVAVIALSFVQAYRDAAGHMRWRLDAVTTYLRGMDEAQRAMREVNTAQATSDATAKQTAMTSLTSASATLERNVAPDAQSAAVTNELTAALRRHQEMMAAGASAGEMVQSFAACESAMERFNEWYETEGAKQIIRHGFTFAGADAAK